MSKFSLLLSVLFHPMLMATYGVAILLFGLPGSVYDFMTPAAVKWSILSMVFLITFVLPVLNIYLLYKLKRIPSLLLSDRESRGLPYVITALFYFGQVYLLLDVNIWNSIKVFIFGAGLAILLCAFINRWYKISAHLVGLGGLLGVLFSVSMLLQTDLVWMLFLLVIIAGLLGTARMVLAEHKGGELLSGFALGLLVQFGFFLILRQLSFHYIL